MTEPKWPEKKVDVPHKWEVDGLKYETWDPEIKGWNEAIDACLVAHEAEKAKWVPSVEEIDNQLSKHIFVGVIKTEAGNTLMMDVSIRTNIATVLHEWLKGRVR